MRANLKVVANRPRVRGDQITRLRSQADAWEATVDLRLQVSNGIVDQFCLDVPPQWSGPFKVDPPAAIKIADSPGKTRRRLTIRPRSAVEGEYRLSITGPLTLPADEPPQRRADHPGGDLHRQASVDPACYAQTAAAGWETRGLVPADLPKDLPGLQRGARCGGSLSGRQGTLPCRACDLRSGPMGRPLVLLADVRMAWTEDGQCRGVAAFDLEPAGLTSCLLSAPRRPTAWSRCWSTASPRSPHRPPRVHGRSFYRLRGWRSTSTCCSWGSCRRARAIGNDRSPLGRSSRSPCGKRCGAWSGRPATRHLPALPRKRSARFSTRWCGCGTWRRSSSAPASCLPKRPRTCRDGMASGRGVGPACGLKSAADGAGIGRSRGGGRQGGGRFDRQASGGSGRAAAAFGACQPHAAPSPAGRSADGALAGGFRPCPACSSGCELWPRRAKPASAAVCRRRRGWRRWGTGLLGLGALAAAAWGARRGRVRKIPLSFGLRRGCSHRWSMVVVALA